MVTGVGAWARFVIYVNSLLYASEAHPVGLESLGFRAEAVAVSLGLTAIVVLKDTHSYSSIRILADYISIWSHLSFISKTSSIHIQWIPAHTSIPELHIDVFDILADLEAKRGSTLTQTSICQRQRF